MSALAQAIDTARPQMEMMKRIDFEISNYATRLKLGSTVITYCRVQMQLDTRHASDGSIPFGVNYRNIQSQEELKNIIWIREAYEITYLKLCIARAKRDLEILEKP
ncbi:hypothetical protein [Methylobacterium sp. 17Sr1-1]|uniref:hypothetical protein n=1 Tax=Methylobacterium sp. 17Sr1-1 TaxID=2202826 RepID=UPI0013A52D82|nr:hypothetical protein [Methylobacterium sp. 17Sr1-1]